MIASERLQFSSPFRSFIDTSFFQELSRLKLEVFKLDTNEKEIYSELELGRSNDNRNVFLNKQSFNFDDVNKQVKSGPLIKGKLFNFNTVEEFKNLDKIKFLTDRVSENWSKSLQNIDEAVTFNVISFADLKKNNFIYWVSFPYFQASNLSINVVKKNPIDDSIEKYLRFFEEHPSTWVGCVNKAVVSPYTATSFSKTSKLLIRDLGNKDCIPTALTKSFLTIIKNNHKDVTELEILFVRCNGTSFSMTVSLDVSEDGSDKLNIGGWEKNSSGKLTPIAIDLSRLIDPVNIVDQSVDLNLMLMKWRIAPELDLDVIKNSKVLLIGAGTLGCYVSRSLMAWGVRKMTFIDSGTVSMSNPVRQPLYEFEDTGKIKAEAAASHLKKIFPSLDVTGENLNVPMIGHPISDVKSVKQAVEKLDALIKSHDVIYILMDSREARWLPTVLGNVHNKIVFNVALGFDSYLVIRHGNQSQSKEKRLGCYFCNDVVAPADSLSDRTLDQMCTVTRPGVAMMAASQAVEVLASLLQASDQNLIEGETILGETPHQIRGFLHNFNILKLKTPAYEYCSACSDVIVDMCRNEGWNFLENALADPKFVETMSGLESVHKSVEQMADEIEWSEPDSFDGIS